ncbi:hypothetical protein DFJ77DRAFT_107183 [Powellomyces hirtus]|nr:hypothetical protein DFJ77DRAFT_107183 [Powellomyces hirtus]
MLSRAPYARHFCSAPDVDSYVASPPKTPSHATGHLRTAALGYFNVGAYLQAESYLRKYLDAIENDVEAIEALACTYVKVGKANQALPLYERLLQYHPKSPTVRLEIARLQLLLAEAEESSIVCHRRVEQALHILQRCQDVNHQISAEALLALDETYRFVAQNCPESAIPTLLLPELLATAGLYETKQRETLHIWLLKAILDSGEVESAWNYVSNHRQELANSLGWLDVALEHFDDLTRGCNGPQRDMNIAELNLWLTSTQTRLIFERDTESPERRMQLISLFECLIDETDSLLPLLDETSNTFWAAMRSEYTATARLLRAMDAFRTVSDDLDVMTDVKHSRSILQTAMGELRMCISYMHMRTPDYTRRPYDDL